MLFKTRPYLLGKNRENLWYIINLETGAKMEMYYCKVGAKGWPDEITANDVIRAKERDNKDITALYNKQKKGLITGEEMLKHKEEVEKFLKSDEFQTEIKNMEI